MGRSLMVGISLSIQRRAGLVVEAVVGDIVVVVVVVEEVEVTVARGMKIVEGMETGPMGEAAMVAGREVVGAMVAVVVVVAAMAVLMVAAMVEAAEAAAAVAMQGTVQAVVQSLIAGGSKLLHLLANRCSNEVHVSVLFLRLLADVTFCG